MIYFLPIQHGNRLRLQCYNGGIAALQVQVKGGEVPLAKLCHPLDQVIWNYSSTCCRVLSM